MLLRSHAVNYLRLARWAAFITFAILFYMLNASYFHSLQSEEARFKKSTRSGSLIELKPPDQAYIEAVKAARDENGVVIVMSANNAYLPMVLNMECSMKRVGIKHALLIAFDRKIFEWARKRPFFAPVMHEEAERTRTRHRLVEFGTSDFPDLTMQKLSSAERVLATGVSVLFTDADVFFCTNPIKEIIAAADKHRDRPILFQSSWSAYAGGDIINSGFFFARPKDEVRKLLLQVLADHDDKPVAHDQLGLNIRLCKRSAGGSVVYEGPSQIISIVRGRPEYCQRDGLRAGFLNYKRFPNQKAQIYDLFEHMSRENLTRVCDNGDVAVLHNNWVLGHGKTSRLKRKGLWYSAPDNETCLESPAPAPLS